MVYRRHIVAITALACLLSLSACGGGGVGGMFKRKAPVVDAQGHVLNANEAQRAAIAKFEGVHLRRLLIKLFADGTLN